MSTWFSWKKENDSRAMQTEETRLVLSSPFDGTIEKVCHEIQGGKLQSNCPTCHRPVLLEQVDAVNPPDHYACLFPKKENDKFAYAVCLWGQSLKYVNGAIVLGQSIRNQSAKVQSGEIDLLCLVTPDVPEENRSRLKKCGFKCILIEHLDDIADNLFSWDRKEWGAHRFDHVFTKLRLFEACVGYDKVLLMDIDMLCIQSIDHLFELPAPAAMMTGQSEWTHGKWADGSFLFNGPVEKPVNAKSNWDNTSWGRACGINAGLMLLVPNVRYFEAMKTQLKDKNHPEHIRGNGPEQDYLARFFSDRWTSICKSYNFQLHQMFHCMAPALNHKPRGELVRQAAGCENALEHLKVIHYSGEKKPWDFATKFFPFGCAEQHEEIMSSLDEFQGYRLFIKKEQEDWDVLMSKKAWNIDGYMCKDGQLYKTEGLDTEEDRLNPPEKAKVDVLPELEKGALRICEASYLEWFKTYRQCVKNGLIDEALHNEKNAKEAAFRSVSMKEGYESANGCRELASEYRQSTNSTADHKRNDCKVVWDDKSYDDPQEDKRPRVRVTVKKYADYEVTKMQTKWNSSVKSSPMKGEEENQTHWVEYAPAPKETMIHCQMLTTQDCLHFQCLIDGEVVKTIRADSSNKFTMMFACVQGCGGRDEFVQLVSESKPMILEPTDRSSKLNRVKDDSTPNIIKDGVNDSDSDGGFSTGEASVGRFGGDSRSSVEGFYGRDYVIYETNDCRISQHSIDPDFRYIVTVFAFRNGNGVRTCLQEVNMENVVSNIAFGALFTGYRARKDDAGLSSDAEMDSDVECIEKLGLHNPMADADGFLDFLSSLFKTPQGKARNEDMQRVFEHDKISPEHLQKNGFFHNQKLHAGSMILSKKWAREKNDWKKERVYFGTSKDGFILAESYMFLKSWSP